MLIETSRMTGTIKRWKTARILGRWILKSSAFVLLTLVVLNPNLRRAGLQVRHTLQPENLIQTNFAGIKAINSQIDCLIATNHKHLSEARAVERFVYKKIHYVTDYENWGNIEYWPTAEETWLKRQEDCDGRAILAVSILRSRGYQSARLVVGLNHMWIQVDENEKHPKDPEKLTSLLGPEPRTRLAINHNPDAGHFVRLAKALLNPTALKGTGAGLIGDIPDFRKIVLMLSLLILCYHPCKDWMGLLAISSAGYAGMNLLIEWGHSNGGPLEFVSGLILLAAAIVGSLFMNRLKDKAYSVTQYATRNTFPFTPLASLPSTSETPALRYNIDPMDNSR